MSEAEALLAQAVSALDAGQLETAADRFERAARILGPVRRDDAVHALTSAARIAMMLDDSRRASTALSQARALAPAAPTVLRLAAELEERSGEPAAQRTAWDTLAAAGDPAQRRYALLKLADLARRDQQHAIAADYFERVAAELPPEAPAVMRAELQLEIAVALTACDERAAAARALVEATALLPAGDTDEIAVLRNRIAGQRGVLALAAGDLDAALGHAQTARDGAVATDDVMTYLGASSLIAMIHEQAGRLVDAYDTYVRARESLRELHGDDGAGLVAPAITLFEERLGREAFQTVWNTWVAQRRASR